MFSDKAVCSDIIYEYLNNTTFLFDYGDGLSWKSKTDFQAKYLHIHLHANDTFKLVIIGTVKLFNILCYTVNKFSDNNKFNKELCLQVREGS